MTEVFVGAVGPNALVLGCVASLALLGCGEVEVSDGQDDRVTQPTVASGDARVGGDVVATVDGIPITLGEVEALAREARIPVTIALRHLEDELVLSRAAERAGIGAAPEVADEVQRAAVRAFLHRVVEPAHSPEAVTVEEIEARRRSIASGLAAPETRRASHLLVQLPADAPEAQVQAASRLAQQLHDEIASEPDPAAALDGYGGPRASFELLVEHLDAMARAELEAPFADAVFTAAAPGLLPRPVRTSFGVHVVVLEEIVPPWEVPREEWEPSLRRQLAAEHRAAATDELVNQLAGATSVTVNAQAQALLEQITFEEGSRQAPLGGGG